MELSERQHDILAAAKSIISSQGLANLTVRSIAGRLKITDAALYRHFKSKRDIISFLIDDVEKTLLAVIAEASAAGSDPTDSLRRIFVSHVSYAEQRKGLTFLLINETLAVDDAVLRKKMHGVINQYLQQIAAVLRLGSAQGCFRKDVNFDAASLAFFGSVQSAITCWALDGYRSEITHTKVQALFDIYVNGISGTAVRE